MESEPLAHSPFAQISQGLRQHGMYAALELLNLRTRYRYTGVYQFAPPLLRNVCLFDRENPRVRTMDDLVLHDSYCGIVARSGESFAVKNSLTDERLTTHPARATIIAYHGFPLRDATDRCFGSLCHWDVRPRLLPSGEAQLLHDVAPMIAHAVLFPRRRARGRRDASSLRGELPARERMQVRLDDEANDRPRRLRRKQPRGGK